MVYSDLLPESEIDSETRLLYKILGQFQILPDKDCSDVDWDHFLTLLDSHRLSNTVYTDGALLPYLPADIKARLQEKYKASQYRMLGYMAELHTLVSLLKLHSIPSIALKGPMLGQAYYASSTQRECKDLDILVRPSDFQKASDLLAREGYQTFDSPVRSPKQQKVYMKNFHHCGFYHPTKHIQVELHWKLYFSKNTDTDETGAIWKNRNHQKVGALEIPVLSGIDNFIYLCVHGGGYSHQWRRLFWVQDIANIIRKEGDEFVRECYQLSIRYGAERYVLEGCLLAHLIFGTQLPTQIHGAISNDQQIATLARTALHAISNVTSSDLSLTPSWFSLRAGFLTFRRIHILGGVREPFLVFKRIFIYLEGWQIYSFSDRFFALNYLIAPFLRLYSVFAQPKTPIKS